MSGAPRVMLNWTCPPEWERFVQWVREKHGYTNLYVGIEIELAWRKFQEEHRAQELANHLLEGRGGPSRETDEKKKILSRSRETGEGRASVRVLSDVKEGMSQFATENDVAKHQVLRAVVCWRLAGDRLDRVADTLEKVVDAEPPEPETTPCIDESKESLSKGERVTQSICDDLDDAFTDSALEEAIHQHAGRGERASDPTTRKYRERVLEHRNVKSLENESGVTIYYPVEKWTDLLAGSVIDSLGGVSTKNECEPFTREEYLAALDSEGVEIDESNKEEINEIADRLLERLDFALQEDLGETGTYVPIESDDVDREQESGSSDGEELQEADTQMDALMDAQVATDGGEVKDDRRPG